MQWIAIADLVIDEDYQRPLGPANWAAIRRIATAFEWARFSPLLVSPVPGGRFAVIDGQHRAHAAAICGIETVPAVVVHIPREAQARAFVGVNTAAIRISGHHIYRAALTAREDWAIRSRDAVAAAGCELKDYQPTASAKRVRQVWAPLLIKDFIDRGHDRAVTAGLAAVVAVDGGTRVTLYHDAILRPWIGALCEWPAALDMDLPAFLTRTDPWKVVEAGRKTPERPNPMPPRAIFVRLLKQAGGGVTMFLALNEHPLRRAA